MTKHETLQLPYEKFKNREQSIKAILEGNVRNIDVELKGNKYWKTYGVEYTIKNVYYFTEDLMALDVAFVNINGQHSTTKFTASDRKSMMSAGEFKRLVSDFSSLVTRELRSESLFKTLCYKVKHLHINNVTI